eukprot:CAMPEP_0113494102 /NCGR_PEP_ID=MMETSP0014_2-20120614/28935_1 /TAXON_ID=2857 /ORGANISM="Nitzschia sp." /LENGTH=1134 /DNA_ID=CAMNT_0000387987 /DNA_START=67 /DNA_END=3474 /DNA_ORIENTATION=+ /assembly_acc=CAM_ASM_000159
MVVNGGGDPHQECSSTTDGTIEAFEHPDERRHSSSEEEEEATMRPDCRSGRRRPQHNMAGGGGGDPAPPLYPFSSAMVASSSSTGRSTGRIRHPWVTKTNIGNATGFLFLVAVAVAVVSSSTSTLLQVMPLVPVASAYVLPQNNNNNNNKNIYRPNCFRSSFAPTTTSKQQQQKQKHRCSMIPSSSSLYFSSAVAFSRTHLRPQPQPTVIMHRTTAKTSTSSLFMSSSEKTVKGRKTSETDKREWKAVVTALQIYKAAYGDLKVPKKFIVPSMKPWPEISWDLKLGQKVASIRETGLYIGSNEQRRTQLDKLGFVWRARAPPSDARDTAEGVPFSQVYDALVAYRENIKPTGQLNVPLDFTVPDTEPWPENTRGLPLGLTIESLKSEPFLGKNPSVRKKLQEIGVLEENGSDQNMTANDKRFQAIYDALSRYKDIYGDLLVPQSFVIPENSQDFPEHTWGIRLGARVNNIRTQGSYVKNSAEREHMLNEIGFVWNPPQKESKKRGRRSLSEIDEEEREALQAQSSSRSSTDSEPSSNDDDDDEIESFLSSFDFSDSGDEEDDPSMAPKALSWGLEARDDDEDSTGDDFDLETSGMNEDPDEDLEEPENLRQSLAAAKVRAVEAGIVEPEDTKRPTKRKREPPMPWYNDDFGDDFVFEDVVEALTLYKEFYGDFSNLTNEAYSIPVSGDSDSEYDEFDALSAELMNMADGLSSAEIEATRFEQDPSSMTNDQIEAEISKMEESMLAPQPQWPEHLEGMRLGNIFRRIRDGSLEVKHLPERKAELDAIGFDWGDPRHFLDVAFEKAVCAMQAYYTIRGDMFVPFDFVMPDSDPWPTALAGYELGAAVVRIRELQNFFEVFHEDKKYVLRMLDFVWFPTLAHSIDPNEGPMTADRLLLVGMGHPDFQSIRIGPRERADPDRPDFLGADPRQWWRVWKSWEYKTDATVDDGFYDDAHRLRKKGDPKLAEEHEELYGPGLYAQVMSLTEDLLGRKLIIDEDEKDALADVIADSMYQTRKCVDFDEEDTEMLVQKLTEARLRHNIEDREIQIIDEDEELEEKDDEESADLESEAERIANEGSPVAAFEEEELDEEDVEDSDETEDEEEYEYEWEYDSEFEEELGLDASAEEQVEEEQVES